MTPEDSDRALIVETLEHAGWVVGGPRGAAAKLGLKRTTLLAKMRRLGISRPIHQEETDVLALARAGHLRPDPTVNQYAVTADGRKFLVLEPQKHYLETYSVVLNWPEA